MCHRCGSNSTKGLLQGSTHHTGNNREHTKEHVRGKEKLSGGDRERKWERETGQETERERESKSGWKLKIGWEKDRVRASGEKEWLRRARVSSGKQQGDEKANTDIGEHQVHETKHN